MPTPKLCFLQSFGLFQESHHNVFSSQTLTAKLGRKVCRADGKEADQMHPITDLVTGWNSAPHVTLQLPEALNLLQASEYEGICTKARGWKCANLYILCLYYINYSSFTFFVFCNFFILHFIYWRQMIFLIFHVYSEKKSKSSMSCDK